MSSKSAVPRHDAVVLLRTRDSLPEHEAMVHRDIAMRIADFLDVPFQGMFDPKQHAALRCYYVPDATIVGRTLRESLGIQDEQDLFGGYAEYDFMPTKAISHGLLSPQAAQPEGWSTEFSARVAGTTLPGFTAFSPADVREAARILLEKNRLIRLKPVHATAGRGQVVVRKLEELEPALAAHDPAELRDCGMVLEAQLDDVLTYSVGQFRLPGLTASYIGTQCLTRDNAGEEVYGGSRLCIRRGGFQELLRLEMDEEARRAVEMAAAYDAAADACYPEFFASRRNYDVAAGIGAHGQRLIGVLEQSWRIGGASRAEIAAMEVFAADADCTCLWAETLELFGSESSAPPNAIETFSGEDTDLGMIRKYVTVEAYGNQQ